MQVSQVWSLVGELRSHMLCSQKKKIKNNVWLLWKKLNKHGKTIPLFGTIHIPLASGEKVQNRSVFESCMSGTDSTSGNRILGWKSFSLGILLVLLHSLSAFTASVQIWHAFMNPVSLYVTCLYFLDAFIGTFYFLKFHDENLKIRKWIISSKMVMVSNKLLW